MKDGKITVVEHEAEQVRLIFRRYLELSGVNAFGGTLFYLLRNRFYIGEVRYKGEILPGEQPPIMERALFDAVQQKLTDQWTARTSVRNAGDHVLTGLLFDDAGHRMAPTHATKAGIRYRYYVSLPCLHGEAKTAKVGSVRQQRHDPSSPDHVRLSRNDGSCGKPSHRYPQRSADRMDYGPSPHDPRQLSLLTGSMSRRAKPAAGLPPSAMDNALQPCRTTHPYRDNTVPNRSAKIRRRQYGT
jgi:hypothetical protein